MFIRVKEKTNGKKSVQIVENQRKASGVHQKIMRHVGIGVHDWEVEELKKLADTIIKQFKEERQPTLPFYSPEELVSQDHLVPADDVVNIKDLKEEQRVVDGINDVFGKLFNDLGFHRLIADTRRDEQWNDILKTCVIARLANPASKLRTAALLEQDYGINLPLDRIYRMMDHLSEREEQAKQLVGQATCDLFQNAVDVLFFDVTTLYFESVDADDLRKFGYSKDCKFNEVQVVLALISTTDGFPITYEVFPGNTFEGHTLIPIIEKLRSSYNVRDLMLVADRAMFNEAALSQMESIGVKYIVAAKLRSLPKTLKTQIIDSDDYKAESVVDELHWLKEFSHKGRRLVVSYSRNRAIKDAKDRSRLVERLLKKTKDKECKLSEFISNHGTKKFLDMKGGTAQVNEEKIGQDELWDGLHGVISNVDPLTYSGSALLSRYRDLWQIEAAFRLNKHDLKMRPIFHFTPERIRAHIAICFFAYALIKHALHRIRIQQKENLSFERLRNELLQVQSSIYYDRTTKKRFRIPSNVTVLQQKIYQTLGLQRSQVPMRFVKINKL